mgnify:CR=1 FL=1
MTLNMSEQEIVGIKFEFLHCNKEKAIIGKMYVSDFDNITRNRDKYLAFL